MPSFFVQSPEDLARQGAEQQAEAEAFARFAQIAAAHIGLLVEPGGLFILSTSEPDRPGQKQKAFRMAVREGREESQDKAEIFETDLGPYEVGTLDDALRYTWKHRAASNLYVATATFGQPAYVKTFEAVTDPSGCEVKPATRRVMADRRQRNVVARRAIVVDADCKSEKHPHGYETHAAILASIDAICTRTGLPAPTLVINSGSGGGHLYWLTERALTGVVWRGLAEGLKTFLERQGFAFDGLCTIDASRVLRLIGSFNFKRDPANPGDVVLTRRGTYTDPEAFRTFLVAAGLFDAEKAVLGFGYAGRSGGNGRGGGDREPVIWDPADPEPIFAGCAQLQRSRDSQGADEKEPIWRATLSILKAMRDPLDQAQKVYGERDDFSVPGTDHKMQSVRAPYTCARFDEVRPGPCPTCPSWGRIRSPVNLDVRARAHLTLADETVYLKVRGVFETTVIRHGAGTAFGTAFAILDAEARARAPAAGLSLNAAPKAVMARRQSVAFLARRLVRFAAHRDDVGADDLVGFLAAFGPAEAATAFAREAMAAAAQARAASFGKAIPTGPRRRTP